jgi:hypothetical protein
MEPLMISFYVWQVHYIPHLKQILTTSLDGSICLYDEANVGDGVLRFDIPLDS